MEATIKLSINELEEFLNRAISKLREKKTMMIWNLKKTFIGILPIQNCITLIKKPIELTIGQLSEDIDMINESKQREIKTKLFCESTCGIKNSKSYFLLSDLAYIFNYSLTQESLACEN